ncbi:MAG: DUF2075 domain-containing protein [Planctomycetes bacterium]|nr:DUF2075 domain-containing protein [Planctomycetota bacterium]
MNRTPSDDDRFPTGVPGLDTVLGGGLLRGGVYIVQGTPGAGKTVLANHVSYEHAAAGGKVVYVTLLAESHGRLLAHLRGFEFFRPELVPGSIYYVSAFRLLEEEGLKGLLDLLRREVRSHQASLLVLDGLVAVGELAPSARELKKFIHELQAHAALATCTALLLTNGREGHHPEHTVVDGVIELHDRPRGARDVRELQVRKFRGSDHVRGRHVFRLSRQGLQLFPRLEGLLPEPSRLDTACAPERLQSGCAVLDDMLGGGLPCGSTTVVLGPPGSGKTTLGLQLLSRASAAEPALLFGFYERPPLVLDKSDALGLGLRARVADGSLDILWQPPTENILDELGHRLLEAVRRRGVRRLVVDGVAGFQDAAPDGRASPFFTALTNELRALAVTTLYTAETPRLFDVVEAPIPGMSAVFENLLLLRVVEHAWRPRRSLTISKVRDSAFDPGARELTVEPGRGVVIADGPFDPTRPLTPAAPARPAKRRAPRGKRRS